jgi:hypothetical protein
LAGKTSLLLYGLSFSYDVVDKLFPWLIPLFAVFIVLQIFIVFHHNASTGRWRWYWNELTRGKPAWVAFFYYLLMATFAGHFIWSIHENGPGVPAIIDGQYVLDSNGRIFKELTEQEYLRLRSLDLRTFAMLFIFFYFVHAVYWHFQNDDGPVNQGG